MVRARVVVASWALASGLRKMRSGSLEQQASATCSVQPQDRSDCGFLGVDQGSCEARGCCWSPVNPNPGNAPWCFYSGSSSPSPPGICSVQESSRRDCGGSGGEAGCGSRGCCWRPVDPNPNNVPWCFYDDSQPSPSPPAPTPSSPTPPGPSPGFRADRPVGSRDTFVHLFEWKWSDIAKECEEFLGPKGYSAVQISPPNEHMQGNAWWVRYQPVTYELNSRSGDEAAFLDMINRCKAVGVGIYADAVINHIAAGSGVSNMGKPYGGRSTPIYSPRDMHNTGDQRYNCQINDYTNAYEVQYCDLVGLPDLCTSCDYVQGKIAEYLNDMGSKGIAGFRVDAAKHIKNTELEGILGRVNSSLYRFHEVIGAAGEPITPSQYTYLGDVTEFAYFRSLVPSIENEGSLQYLSSFGEPFGFIPSNDAVVFMDNHDTQRSEPELTYKKGAEYAMANVFMLAHPYGYPKVMSSYFFNGFDEAPPGTPVHNNGRLSCFDGSPWVCEHRWVAIANMVNWRISAGTAGVENFQAPSGSTIAFCRGGAACVALNQGYSTWNANVYFSVPPGQYCDVVQSDDPATCPRILVDGNGRASFQLNRWGAVAVHVGKKVA